eukprot:scaffold4212_cov52-Attheya_sp.AAC.7
MRKRRMRKISPPKGFAVRECEPYFCRLLDMPRHRFVRAKNKVYVAIVGNSTGIIEVREREPTTKFWRGRTFILRRAKTGENHSDYCLTEAGHKN